MVLIQIKQTGDLNKLPQHQDPKKMAAEGACSFLKTILGADSVVYDYFDHGTKIGVQLKKGDQTISLLRALRGGTPIELKIRIQDMEREFREKLGG